MFKILFFAAIAAVIYLGWRSVRMKQMELEKRLDQQEKSVQKTQQSGERMVQCANCGVYVPESEAIRIGRDCYCCREHAEAGRRR